MSSSIKTVRKSVALPRELLKSVADWAPRELSGNFNRLVRVALEEFVARREGLAFEAELARMAADPEIQRESGRISREFEAAEGDGLSR